MRNWYLALSIVFFGCENKKVDYCDKLMNCVQLCKSEDSWCRTYKKEDIARLIKEKEKLEVKIGRMQTITDWDMKKSEHQLQSELDEIDAKKEAKRIKIISEAINEKYLKLKKIEHQCQPAGER